MNLDIYRNNKYRKVLRKLGLKTKHFERFFYHLINYSLKNNFNQNYVVVTYLLSSYKSGDIIEQNFITYSNT